MKVNDTITITKDEFIIQAKRALVLTRGGYLYLYDKKFSNRIVESGSNAIPGYIIKSKPSSSNYHDHIRGLWSNFNGRTQFTVVKLPQSIYKSR